MARFLAILLLAVLPTLCIPKAFAAERKVALVVGIGAYETVPRLTNAVADANAIADMFRRIGFDVVTTRTDISNTQLKRVIRDFEDEAATADVAVVFYAGHGIELGDQNYLIPMDAKLADERDIEDEAVPIERVINVLDQTKKLRLVILDACRNNPFVGKMKRRAVTRAISAGLGVVEPNSSNTLIAFAAKARTVANDGRGEHSPFTQALLRNIAIPGLDIRIALGKVRDEVLAETGGQQEPYVYGSLGGSTMALVPAPEITTIEPATLIDKDKLAKDDFYITKSLNSKEAYVAFLSKHPSGFYSDLARVQISKIEASALPVGDGANANAQVVPQLPLARLKVEHSNSARQRVDAKSRPRLQQQTELPAVNKPKRVSAGKVAWSKPIVKVFRPRAERSNLSTTTRIGREQRVFDAEKSVGVGF